VEHLRDAPEGGERCHLCYKMRLDLAAIKAQELGFDYFASALTLSPKKNSQKINQRLYFCCKSTRDRFKECYCYG